MIKSSLLLALIAYTTQLRHYIIRYTYVVNYGDITISTYNFRKVYNKIILKNIDFSIKGHIHNFNLHMVSCYPKSQVINNTLLNLLNFN